jgi:hypothetical protein
VFSYGEKKHAGKMYAFGVPGTRDGSELSLSKAKDLVRKHRWIHVNASMKKRWEAQHNAGILSKALRRPLVLVFMSKSVMDGKRNEYDPNFVKNLGTLASHGIGDRKTLLVTARSYGNSQALHVLRQRANSPRILFIGLCPAFGAFGNKWSANVKRFHQDVKETQVKYCMIASEKDNYAWRAGGACVTKGGRYQGDENVCKAIDKNRSNVKVFTINGAGHDNAEYLANGAMDRMRRCVEHFRFKGKTAGNVVYGRR